MTLLDRLTVLILVAAVVWNGINIRSLGERLRELELRINWLAVEAIRDGRA